MKIFKSWLKHVIVQKTVVKMQQVAEQCYVNTVGSMCALTVWRLFQIKYLLIGATKVLESLVKEM